MKIIAFSLWGAIPKYTIGRNVYVICRNVYGQNDPKVTIRMIKGLLVA